MVFICFTAICTKRSFSIIIQGMRCWQQATTKDKEDEVDIVNNGVSYVFCGLFSITEIDLKMNNKQRGCYLLFEGDWRDSSTLVHSRCGSSHTLLPLF